MDQEVSKSAARDEQLEADLAQARAERDEARASPTLQYELLMSTARERDRFLQERDEARAWVRRLTAQERVLTCVYCGEAYPPGAPTHGAEALTAHIRTCAKHPMREAESGRGAALQRAEAAEANVARMADALSDREASLSMLRARCEAAEAREAAWRRLALAWEQTGLMWSGEHERAAALTVLRGLGLDPMTNPVVPTDGLTLREPT